MALPLPEAVLQWAARLQSELRQSGFTGRTSRTEGLHLTLYFLGEIESGQVPGVCQSLEEVAATAAPFRITVGGVGAFPDVGRPKVIWMGIAPSSELANLHAGLGDRLHALNLISERRSFRPHVTLARIKNQRCRLDGFFLRKRPRDVYPFEVNRIQLYESYLDPRGALYSVASTARLEGE